MSDATLYHFAAATLRDGSPLPMAGDVSEAIGDIEPCVRGWHASERAIDALSYAPGPYVARVRLHGLVIAHGDPIDKFAGERRETLAGYVDITSGLRRFARECALDVDHLWDAPDVVRQYLETGDESLRAAARAAAWAAARDAAWAAAWAAARDAARDAAWAAAWAAAWDAARDAARAAARAAAWAAARDAAWAAAWAAAWDAARAAAWDAARDAAPDAQNGRLTAIIEESLA